MRRVVFLVPLLLAACSKAKMEVDVPGILIEGTAGDPNPLVGAVKVTADRKISYKARPADRWVTVEPAEGTVPGEIKVRIDASTLSSGTHESKVVLESSQADNPVEFKVEVKLGKGRLKFRDAVVTLEGSLGEEQISERVALKTEPAGHGIPWVASVTEPWLEVVPQEGRGPARIKIIAKLKDFGTGEFEDTLTVKSPDATNPARMKIRVKVEPGIGVEPRNTELECDLGTTEPLTATVKLRALGRDSFPYQCYWDAKWLKIDRSSGTLPGEIRLTVDPTGKTVGEHTAEIRVDSAEARPTLLSVKLTVRKTRMKIVGSDPHELECHAGSTKPLRAFAVVRAGSGDGQIPVKAGTTAPWLKVENGTDTTPARLRIVADPTGLKPGEREGKIIVESDHAQAPVEMTVKLNVKPVALAVTPTLTLEMATGGKNPSGTVELKMDPPVDWTADWDRKPVFRIEPAKGTGPATIKITANSRGLTAGRVEATLRIRSTASLKPAECRIVFRIAPKLRAEPMELSGECELGSTDPVRKTLKVTAEGVPNLAYACRAGDQWVQVPAKGKAPESLVVKLDPAGRRPGTYTSEIVLEPEGAKAVRIPVTLTIRKTALRVSRAEVRVESFAGFSSVMTEKVKVLAGADVSFDTTSENRWVKVSPRTAKAGEELALRIDPAGLGSGEHRTHVVLKSDEADPVRVLVVLNIRKIGIRVPKTIKVFGVTGRNRFTARISVETDPPGRPIKWSVKSDAEIDASPWSGRGPGTVGITLKTDGVSEGESTFPVTVESPDAREPARCDILLTVYRAGTAKAMLFVGYHDVKSAYEAWLDEYVGVVSRIAGGHPEAAVLGLEQAHAGLQSKANSVGAEADILLDKIKRIGDKIRAEGLTAKARSLGDLAKSMQSRARDYTSEAKKVVSLFQTKDIVVRAEPRWQMSGLAPRKGDLLHITAEGEWTGSPEWPRKSPDGDPLQRGKLLAHCHEKTLPFFGLIADIGEKQVWLAGSEQFLAVAESGDLRFRPNYKKGEHKGELKVKVRVIRPPWYLRTILTDTLGAFDGERAQYRTSLRDVHRKFLAGVMEEEERRSREKDILSNYTRIRKAREVGMGDYRMRLFADGLRAKLALTD